MSHKSIGLLHRSFLRQPFACLVELLDPELMSASLGLDSGKKYKIVDLYSAIWVGTFWWSLLCCCHASLLHPGLIRIEALALGSYASCCWHFNASSRPCRELPLPFLTRSGLQARHHWRHRMPHLLFPSLYLGLMAFPILTFKTPFVLRCAVLFKRQFINVLVGSHRLHIFLPSL